MLIDRETDVINTFVVSRKRERYIELLRSPKRRQDFLRQLYHFRDFIPSRIVPLSKGLLTEDDVLAELCARGAGSTCYVISVDDKLDGQSGQLAEVIPQVFARMEGTIVSCVPGRLAYYEGEPPQNRFILSSVAGASVTDS
jgi:hypothetical protein